MATFPDKESEVTTLATTMIGGLTNNTGTFAAPPVAPAALQTALGEFNTADGEATQAQAVADQKFAVKRTKLKSLAGLMRQDLNYAEGIPNITDAQLHLIGWSKPAPPSALQAPAQCPNFEVLKVNGSAIELDWKKPLGGGKPAGYKIVKRSVGSTEWTLHDLATRDQDNVTLPAGHWELAVRAFNNAGDGPLSNSVMVTV